MAIDVPTQTIRIKDLATKSVVLYPTRAHVTREINDVVLKPGVNELVIYGLTPTVDEHSIQIEGKGTASIVDMTTDLVPNHDVFEDVYPEDSADSSSESEAEYEDSDDEAENVKNIAKELKALQAENRKAIETVNSAEHRLIVLKKYAESIHAHHNSPEEVTKLLEKYEEERLACFVTHASATKRIEELTKKIDRKEIEKLNAGRQGRKEKKKQLKQKEKERRQKELRKNENRKEARHIKQERLRYWPKKVYKVTLQLETASTDTPASSRRGSMDSVTLAQSPQLEPTKGEHGKEVSLLTDTTVSLMLSYVTKEAGWTPRYDIKISSLQKTATIVYRTEFLNRTGETWREARLSFSTSQTSYQGLDDAVPFMHAWRVMLGKYNVGDEGLLSRQEVNKSRTGRPIEESFNRSELFGLDDNYVPAQMKRQQFVSSNPQASSAQKPAGGSLFGSNQPSQSAPYQSSHGAFRATTQVFGAASSHANVQLDRGIQHARAVRRGPSPFASLGNQNVREEVVEESENVEEDAETIEAVEFEESTWEDNGLTATYDVPGTRTLVPSSMTRRHKIASLNASNIHMSHICVPKLRSSAFLRAKIRNPSSSVTLLKGSAGVTLDGSFLGNMTLPRVSPGQLFDLPLGVDPSIHVNYPKPSVHRSTQGMMFNKERSQAFTRSIWINNTKATPVELLVLDQTPVSEDERLKIVITTPRGLSREGDQVKAGVSAKEGSSGAIEATGQNKNWGSAVAKMKKNNEINWTVKLEKGQGCLLKLDYEARMPPAEKIIPA